MRKWTFIVIAAGLVLGGCPTDRLGADRDPPPFRADPQLCNAPGHHCRPVTVFQGQIQPIPDIHVSSPNNQIYWEIVTPGYVFPANRGIEFKQPATVPRNEFTCNAIGPKVFHCVDRNTTRGRYDYKVTLTVTETGRDIGLDPSILND